MRVKITKQAKQELKELIDNGGYWSVDVMDFIGQFCYISAKQLHQMGQVYSKYGYGL